MTSFNIPAGMQNWGLVAPGDAQLGVSLEWDLNAQFPVFTLGPAPANCRYRCFLSTQIRTDPAAGYVPGNAAVGAEFVDGCSLHAHCCMRVGWSLALIS